MPPNTFVNHFQTPEERASKYWLARSLGANSYLANRMRDWRISKIERRYGLVTSNKQNPVAQRALQHLDRIPFLMHPSNKRIARALGLLD